MSTPQSGQPNISGQPVVVTNDLAVQTSAAQGVVTPAPANPAATTASADYTFAWSGVIRHVLLQNSTAAAINYEIDGAATPGSPVLAAGQTVFLDVILTTLHLLATAAVNVNGNAASNIVVRGWA